MRLGNELGEPCRTRPAGVTRKVGKAVWIPGDPRDGGAAEGDDPVLDEAQVLLLNRAEQQAGRIGDRPRVQRGPGTLPVPGERDDVPGGGARRRRKMTRDTSSVSFPPCCPMPATLQLIALQPNESRSGDKSQGMSELYILTSCTFAFGDISFSACPYFVSVVGVLTDREHDCFHFDSYACVPDREGIPGVRSCPFR